MKSILTVILLGLFLLVSTSGLSNKDSVFHMGVKSLSDGDFKQAIAFLEEDLTTNPSFEVFYNLGIAYGEIERWNDSYWASEAALKWKPSDNNAIFNAQFALSKVDDKITWNHPYSWTKRVVLSLSPLVWYVLSLIVSIISAALIFYLIVNKKKNNFFQFSRIFLVIILPLLFLFVFAGFTASNHYSNTDYIISKHTDVETFANENGIKLKESLKLGMRYPYITETEGWIQLLYSDNRPVWVEKKDVRWY